jgi:hypothetical protein
MSTAFPKMLFGIIAAAAALAACHGGNYTPASDGSAPLPMVAHMPGSARLSPRLPDCKAGRAKIPGTYVIMNSDGNVKRGAYASIDGNWFEGKVTPTSTPSASPSGEPSPPTQAIYLYVGTYHLKNSGQTGCAYLVTTVSGKPLMDSRNNASFDGTPDFSTEFFAFNVTKFGKLVAAASGLSASGGSGRLTLKTRKGTYDTGTIAFTGRIRRRGP